MFIVIKAVTLYIHLLTLYVRVILSESRHVMKSVQILSLCRAPQRRRVGNGLDGTKASLYSVTPFMAVFVKE